MLIFVALILVIERTIVITHRLTLKSTNLYPVKSAGTGLDGLHSANRIRPIHSLNIRAAILRSRGSPSLSKGPKICSTEPQPHARHKALPRTDIRPCNQQSRSVRQYGRRGERCGTVRFFVSAINSLSVSHNPHITVSAFMFSILSARQQVSH